MEQELKSREKLFNSIPNEVADTLKVCASRCAGASYNKHICPNTPFVIKGACTHSLIISVNTLRFQFGNDDFNCVRLQRQLSQAKCRNLPNGKFNSIFTRYATISAVFYDALPSS
jgi:hypothetical protein